MFDKPPCHHCNPPLVIEGGRKELARHIYANHPDRWLDFIRSLKWDKWNKRQIAVYAGALDSLSLLEQEGVITLEGEKPAWVGKNKRSKKNIETLKRAILPDITTEGDQENLIESPSEGGRPKKEVKEPKDKSNRTVATVQAPSPAAIIFRLGKAEIPLDPQDLYEAFILYKDLVVRMGVTDTFSTVLKDSISVTWRLLATKPTIVSSGGNGHDSEPMVVLAGSSSMEREPVESLVDN